MKIAIEGSDEIEGKDARSGISVQFNTYLSQCEAGASRHIREYYHKFLAMADLVLEESDILSL